VLAQAPSRAVAITPMANVRASGVVAPRVKPGFIEDPLLVVEGAARAAPVVGPDCGHAAKVGLDLARSVGARRGASDHLHVVVVVRRRARHWPSTGWACVPASALRNLGLQLAGDLGLAVVLEVAGQAFDAAADQNGAQDGDEGGGDAGAFGGGFEAAGHGGLQRAASGG
jgi:hypothetical protein